jgi:DNA-binding NtrC family response regulator
VGLQDPWRPAARQKGGTPSRTGECPEEHVDGPILTFLRHADRFHALYLLYDATVAERAARLRAAVGDGHKKLVVEPRLIPVDDPRDYSILYRQMRAVCEEAHASHGAAASYNVLLSPGTPQMHAIWVLLAKTVFPAGCWQTSDFAGRSPAEQVDIPFDVQAELVEPALAAAPRKTTEGEIPGLVFRSEAMRWVVEQARLAGESDARVLLLGETGVGKERIARLIHESSPRRVGKFVALDCANLSTTLAESELFGHEAGAFTGASRNHRGIFEQAARGTVFIDEIGELPLSQQPKLLRVLQENRLRRVGGEDEISVDARTISGTHRDLAAMVAAGDLRSDLYYRLKIIEIRVPALRERPDDILPLAAHFLARQNEGRSRRGMVSIQLSKEAESALMAHPWPGNVRELEHAIEAVSATHRGGSVTAKDLRLPSASTDGVGSVNGTKTLRELVKAFEIRVIREAIQRHGSQRAAAPHLGISQQAISQKVGRPP